jgi:predicted nucleic acid-binding protein
VALIARYLIDTSAAARMQHASVASLLGPLIEAGVVATCAVLDAEALWTARDPAEFDRLRADRREAYEYLPTDDEHWRVAFDALQDLARTGRHRSVRIHDLLTAVLARQHRCTVLHYDADFEIAATVLDFQHQWVVARGSL